MSGFWFFGKGILEGGTALPKDRPQSQEWAVQAAETSREILQTGQKEGKRAWMPRAI